MKNISVLIPFRTDHGPREVIFKWILKYYQITMPYAELCIGECDTALFSRSQAINNAAKKATRSVFVIADGDIIYTSDIIYKSIGFLEKYAWVIPFNKIKYLDEHCTKEFVNKEPQCPKVDQTAKKVRKVSLLNIVPRDHFEKIGGFDERFLGWGGEDNAFSYAMNTLCGRYFRTDDCIFHMWHPTNKYKGNLNYEANYQLYLRYRNAVGKKKSMYQLIRERGQ